MLYSRWGYAIYMLPSSAKLTRYTSDIYIYIIYYIHIATAETRRPGIQQLCGRRITSVLHALIHDLFVPRFCVTLRIIITSGITYIEWEVHWNNRQPLRHHTANIAYVYIAVRSHGQYIYMDMMAVDMYIHKRNPYGLQLKSMLYTVDEINSNEILSPVWRPLAFLSIPLLKDILAA